MAWRGKYSISLLWRTWVHFVVATHSSRPWSAAMALDALYIHICMYVCMHPCPYIDRPLAKDIYSSSAVVNKVWCACMGVTRWCACTASSVPKIVWWLPPNVLHVRHAMCGAKSSCIIHSDTCTTSRVYARARWTSYRWSNFCALWQPTHPRVAARFPSFFMRKESTTREPGRVSPWRPLVSRAASSARAGLLVARPSPPRHPVESSTPPRQSVTAATPPSHRFGHANGETASSYISVPPARVSDFLIRSSHRLSH